MVKKKISKKTESKKTKKNTRRAYPDKSSEKISTKGKKTSKTKSKKISKKDIPTLQLKSENDIAMDFAVKVSQKFDKIIKSVVLFGSTSKHERTAGSDIDIILIIDDVSIKWDQELIAWYRQELESIIKRNPYEKSLHITTVKLSTWWEDLMKGDPIVLNILRYGEAMVDLAGFFNPLKYLLIQGKIKATPEAIYNCLQRAPTHLARSKSAELGAIEGLYWTMVDAAHAALIAAKVFPASPQHIPVDLRVNLVNAGKLKQKYVDWYKDLLALHKRISHGEVRDLKGVEIDMWQKRTQEFLDTMAKLVNEIIG
jgi:predicted nucleotidyltransferase